MVLSDGLLWTVGVVGIDWHKYNGMRWFVVELVASGCWMVSLGGYTWSVEEELEDGSAHGCSELVAARCLIDTAWC
jgi:hypothetical protein